MISKDLIKDCRAGHQVAQFRLYKICYSTLMNVTSRYIKDRDEAVDLINLGFYKVLTGLKKYNSDKPFDAWIRRVMINTIIDQYRKNKKYRESTQLIDQSELGIELGSAEFNQAALELDADQLRKFIHELPDMHNQVFNLYAIDGHTHQEISKMLEIPVGTSKWYLNQARKSLQEMVKKSLNQFNQNIKVRIS